MIVRKISPKDYAGPSRSRGSVLRSAFNTFLDESNGLITKVNQSESEEYHKGLITQFLRHGLYQTGHYINTRGRSDLVIHKESSPTSPVAVILEVKRPSNRSEMPRGDSLNCKAMQELVLYFMRERFDPISPNLGIRHLIITNSIEWYIFDAALFERVFAQNSVFVETFREFSAGVLSGTTTDFFYRNIASPAIAMADAPGECVYFDLSAEVADRSLRAAAVYNILSPQTLLKLPAENDSNSLNRTFYSELLHIMGLSERKDGSRRVIGRALPEARHDGSLIENTISRLRVLEKVNRVSDVWSYGDSQDERTYGVALALVITWIS